MNNAAGSSPGPQSQTSGGAAPPELASLDAFPRTWVSAIADRDFDSIARVVSPEVAFRALVPRGVREADTSDGVIGWVRRWFGDADIVEVLSVSGDDVADRIGFGYRVRVHEPDGWSVVEQKVYATVVDGRAVKVDLLCSGFMPMDAPDGGPAEAVEARTTGSGTAARLDALGADCATLVPTIARSIAALPVGGVLDILTDDPTASPTLAAWTRLTGHELVSSTRDAAAGTHWLVRKKES